MDEYEQQDGKKIKKSLIWVLVRYYVRIIQYTTRNSIHIWYPHLSYAKLLI